MPQKKSGKLAKFVVNDVVLPHRVNFMDGDLSGPDEQRGYPLSRHFSAIGSRISAVLLAGAAGIFVLPVSSQAAGFEMLRAHRAIYEVKLDKASDRSGIQNMTGRIVYELVGNACDGISVRYRFVSKVSANGEMVTSDQQTATFESADGKEYDFLTKSLVNEQLVKTVKGVARKADGGIEVDIEEPARREVKLPDAEFISSHIIQVLDHAMKGDSFFSIDVFDGGEEADEVLRTTNVVGKEGAPDKPLPGEKADALAPLEGVRAWPVNIGYFKTNAQPGAETLPVYEVSFTLYENGISRNLSMRYPDYSLNGTLVGLEMLDQGDCKPQK